MSSWNRIIAVFGLTVACTTAARGANEDATIVLHAQPWDLGLFCQAWVGQFDCNGMPPVVNVQPEKTIAVFVLLRNYDAVSSVRYLFEVDGGKNGIWGDWTMIFSDFGCLPGQTTASAPASTNGVLETNFLCIEGGALRVIGLMAMTSGSHGCLEISEVEFSGIQDCDQVRTDVAPRNRGRICVGDGGYNACDAMPVPVEGATWGAIKAQYR
jgi:hypothetical protein